jgi:hypothetical protein
MPITVSRGGLWEDWRRGISQKPALSDPQMFRSTKICYLAKLLILADCIYSLNSVNTGLLIESLRLTVPPGIHETPETTGVMARFLLTLREARTSPRMIYGPFFQKLFLRRIEREASFIRLATPDNLLI